MQHPIRFTYLGFHFNSLVDSGEYLDLKETHLHINEMTLFSWLKGKYVNRFDISLFKEEELIVIESFFANLSFNIDAERKMGVTKNGLCLLIAYCFEGAQSKASEIQ